MPLGHQSEEPQEINGAIRPTKYSTDVLFARLPEMALGDLFALWARQPRCHSRFGELALVELLHLSR
jgi:hypothetical protein